MSVSRPEAIASQPSRWARVASAKVSSNQRRTNGRKSAIHTEFYASAEAHLAQQQAAQRGARGFELGEGREGGVCGHVEGLAGPGTGAPDRGHFLAPAGII